MESAVLITESSLCWCNTKEIYTGNYYKDPLHFNNVLKSVALVYKLQLYVLTYVCRSNIPRFQNAMA
jgi:hypothetical protein